MTTILYIEDSMVAQRFVQKILEPRYRIILANNGLDAIQKGKDLKPDLVLTDLIMPGLDGYEVATRLKSVWPDVPVVAFSSDTSLETRRMALIAGCNGYLTKPVAPHDLLEAVERYLTGYTEILPDTPEIAQEKLAFQQRLVYRLESQIEALTEANTQLATVQQITQAITQTLDFDKVIETALDNLLAVKQLDYLAIFLLNEKDNSLTLAGQRNFSSDYLRQIQNDYAQTNPPSSLKQAIESGKTVVSQGEGKIKTIANIPLILKKKAVGALHIGTQNTNYFSAEQLALIALVNGQLSIAIEQAQIHADLQSAYTELQKLDDLKSRFIMIASHELRTPLTLLMGYAYLLEKGESDPSPEIIKTILEQAEVLNQIINRILLVEQLQNEGSLAEFTEIALNREVESVVETIKPLAGEKKLAFNFIPLTTDISVWTDRIKFKTIITNLIGNAIQFTPPGGTIDVSVLAQETVFEIAVVDNGVGIPPDEQNRIFDKFYQVKNPLKRDHGGVGLGLSIAKDMANLCGGNIKLTSQPNHGSTFVYSQPINPTQPK